MHMNEKTGTGDSSKKEKITESQYIVSGPGLGSDPPFESDRESGCDIPRPFHELILIGLGFLGLG